MKVYLIFLKVEQYMETFLEVIAVYIRTSTTKGLITDPTPLETIDNNTCYFICSPCVLCILIWLLVSLYKNRALALCAI